MYCLSQIGVAYEQSGDKETSWEYHQKAMNLANKYRWKCDGDYYYISETFSGLGDFASRYGSMNDAQDCFMAALNIDLRGLNTSKPHPRIARRLTSVSKSLKGLDRLEEALSYEKQANDILKSFE